MIYLLIHIEHYEATFCPSIFSSTRWLILKAKMLPVKEKCKYIFRYYIVFIVETK
jgi:hypothetical protein